MNKDFAFPFPEIRWPDGTGVMDGSCGMTKRELIAMHVLSGMVSSESEAAGVGFYAPKGAAERAVEFTDALLSALGGAQS